MVKSERAPTPLVARQTLEAESPDAFFKAAAMEEQYAQYRKVCEEGGKAFEVSAVSALPVVLASFVWESAEHADPKGDILSKICFNLARQMPTFAAWGFDDVGVFIDWSCMYQSVPSAGLTRNAQQEGLYNAARKHLQIYFSHRMTTVYVLDDQESRKTSGWAFFEECPVRSLQRVAARKAVQGAQRRARAVLGQGGQALRRDSASTTLPAPTRRRGWRSASRRFRRPLHLQAQDGRAVNGREDARPSYPSLP